MGGWSGSRITSTVPRKSGNSRQLRDFLLFLESQSVNNTLENALCRLHQQSHACLTANATTGLVLALTALGLRGKRIGIPNSVCMNVPLAVLLSGNIPHYLDVSERNFGIAIDDLVRQEGRIDAVIAVHAYGAVCDIDEIATYCKLRRLPLIEDLAVAQGADVEGQPVGSFADIAVVSFGAGKIIDVGHGGAVLTSQQPIMTEILALEARLARQEQSSEQAVHEFGQYHTDLYNKHYAAGTINAQSVEFKARALELGRHFLGRFTDSYRTVIHERLERLDALVRARREKAEMLERLLAPHEASDLAIHRPPAGSVPWRFNALIEGRDRLLRSMLAKKMKVSSWFPSVDLFFEERARSAVATPLSDGIGKRILNLWVNEEVDDHYINMVVDELIDHVTRNRIYGTT